MMTRPKKDVTRCGVCRKVVQEGSYALGCDAGCDKWYHIECVGITIAEHDRLVETGEEWYCEICSLKNDKSLLNEEIKNLSQTISLLQTDLQELNGTYLNLKNQNLNLNEMCLRKEEEIVLLKNELDNVRSKLGPAQPYLDKQNNCSYSVSMSGSLSEFPPLRVSNRFSPLLYEDDVVRNSNTPPVVSKTRVPNRPNNEDISSPINSSSRREGVRFSTPSNFNSTRRGIRNNQINTSKDLFNDNRWQRAVPKSVKTRTVAGQSSLRVGYDKSSCTKRVPKLLIMSDSHGRDMGQYINLKTDKTKLEVFSVCRPGAGLVKVMSGIESYSDGFTKQDNIVIIGGSNDIVSKSRSLFTESIISRLKAISEKTNVILCSLPIRFDRPELNDAVHQCNFELYEGALSVVKIVPFNNIHRKYFTKHGQHLNKTGKFILISRILKAVHNVNSNDFLD